MPRGAGEPRSRVRSLIQAPVTVARPRPVAPFGNRGEGSRDRPPRRLRESADAGAGDQPPARRRPRGVRRRDRRRGRGARALVPRRDRLPAGRPGRLRRGDDLRRLDARRPGAEHRWLPPSGSCSRDLLGAAPRCSRVCLGAQLLSEAAGGDARPAREPEIGWFEVELTEAGAERPADRPRWRPGSRPSNGTATSAGCRRARRCWRAAPSARRPSGSATPPGGSSSTPRCRWPTSRPGSRSTVRRRRGADRRRSGRLREETMPRMAAWNDLGHALCERFLAVAGAPTRPFSDQLE